MIRYIISAISALLLVAFLGAIGIYHQPAPPVVQAVQCIGV